jgi:predicted DNA-binding antitoxin AbrB/MazE fold protein
MTQSVQAVYEQGVFRPLEPVDLAEDEQVSLEIRPANTLSDMSEQELLRRQQDTLRQALNEAAELPIEAPDDGLGGADHDFILYGWKK